MREMLLIGRERTAQIGTSRQIVRAKSEQLKVSQDSMDLRRGRQTKGREYGLFNIGGGDMNPGAEADEQINQQTAWGL